MNHVYDVVLFDWVKIILKSIRKEETQINFLLIPV